MEILSALRVFNLLKKKRIFRDYAIGGGVAVSYYIEPRRTKDLDIFLLIDEERLIWDALDKMGYEHEDSIIIKGVPVDIISASQHPFYGQAIKQGRVIRIDGIRVKILTPECLIATKLRVFRGKDRIDILDLLKYEMVDLLSLQAILHGGFKGEEKLLLKRLRRVLEEKE